MLLAQCPVCHECFTNALECNISALPCGHVFHQICIDTWFKTSSTCPQCRIGIKRAFVISRLYFDIVNHGSHEQPVNATELEETAESEISLRKDPSSITSLSVQLHRLRSENMRLDSLCKDLSQKSEESSRLLSARDKEISTLTTLYSQTDKLYEVERQRCRDLRTEISSLKQFLREAEIMKAEAIQLRKETEDMHHVKKLISSSEDAARELLSRYTSKFENVNETSCNKHQKDTDLLSLCKWASILRSELTATREKVSSYRTELSRVRKLQVSASQKIARAENNAAEYKERVKQLENEISNLIGQIHSNSKAKENNPQEQVTCSTPTSITTASHCSTSMTPVRLISMNDDSSLVTPPIKLNSEELLTPDLFLLSPSEYSATVTPRTDFITPANPFRVKPIHSTSSSSPQQIVSTSQTSYNRTLLFSPEINVIDKIPCNNNSIITNQRRPSSLYQLSIMRQHAKIADSYMIPSYSSTFSNNFQFQQPFDRTLSKLSKHCILKTETNTNQKRSVRNLKRPMFDVSKTLKLDNFVMKL
ncbi:hypothetical protein MN116_007092 [Schistosoma mekongi]|uniref:RING-type domain-containing protein n=1 Tax=Schistosoma mekongi TaxID=38744 RepID=A0AAE1Z8G1_SCHME|nr:hypothetical protein MN116_007092 [Schistosoma mekongi]